MFIKNVSIRPCTELNVDISRICPIDQYDGQDFNINESGFIRNDISKLARAQSLSEFDAIMKRIGQIQPEYGVKDDMTVEQAFESVRPRSLQNPCELAYWAEHMQQLDDAYRSATGASIVEPKIESPVVEPKSE